MVSPLSLSSYSFSGHERHLPDTLGNRGIKKIQGPQIVPPNCSVAPGKVAMTGECVWSS